MIPTPQLCPHDPDNNVYGDCMRATLASLLDLPAAEVPHFMEDNPSVEVYHQRISEFLAPKGLALLGFLAWPLHEHKKQLSYNAPIYHGIGDVSPRFPDSLHAVVGKDGFVHYDPHPTNLGLPEVTMERSFDFIVVADMTKFLAYAASRLASK